MGYDTMTIGQLTAAALATPETWEFWLLTGIVAGKLGDTQQAIARQLWKAAHEDPWNEEEARRLLRTLQASEPSATLPENVAPPGARAPTFTCPKCGMTSYNPHDARQRYCGNCREFMEPWSL